MKSRISLIDFSIKHPWMVTAVMVCTTLALVLLAMLPTLWPQTFKPLIPLKVDTDPENMLTANEPVRLFHNRMKRQFALHDMVVVGIVNETRPEGVFNPESLRQIYELTEYAKTLRWPDPENPGRDIGVVRLDLIAHTSNTRRQDRQDGSLRRASTALSCGAAYRIS